jgi:hypothetical protein
MLCEWQVFDACMDHQMEQIQYQTLVVSEIEEGLNTFLLEGFIVRMLVTSHGIDHLLAYTDGRLQHCLSGWVLSEDESEVDVEEMPPLVYHEILQVTVSHRHQVSHCAVPRTTLYVHVQDLLILILIKRLLHCIFPVTLHMILCSRQPFKEVFNPILVIFQQILYRIRLLHKLKHPIVLAKREHLIRSELKIQVNLLQQVVHQLNDLQHQLVLPHIVPALEYHTVFLRRALMVLFFSGFFKFLVFIVVVGVEI